MHEATISLHPPKSRADFIRALQSTPARVRLHDSSPFRQVTGRVPDLPPGRYGVVGPSLADRQWSAVLVKPARGAVRVEAA